MFAINERSEIQIAQVCCLECTYVRSTWVVTYHKVPGFRLDEVFFRLLSSFLTISSTAGTAWRHFEGSVLS
jgi:hypothetical protein